MKSTFFKKLKFSFIVLLLILGSFVTKELILAYSGCGFKAYDGNEVVEFACEDPAVSHLRIFKNGTIYGIPLVNTYNSLASKFRIMTSEGIKALRRKDSIFEETNNWGIKSVSGDDSVGQTYYDYFPAGPHTASIIELSDAYSGYGAFATFLNQETISDPRRAAFSLIPSVGGSAYGNPISSSGPDYDYYSVGLTVDENTGALIAAWPSGEYASTMASYTPEPSIMLSGWISPSNIIDDLHYREVYTQKGPSPVDPDLDHTISRVYAYASYQTGGLRDWDGHGTAGNIIFTYNDFTCSETTAAIPPYGPYFYNCGFESAGWNEINFMTDFPYTGYGGVNLFDDHDSFLYYKAMAVQDNKIAFMGFRRKKSFNPNSRSIFVLYNDNYGEEGSWNFIEQEYNLPISDMGNYFNTLGGYTNLSLKFKDSENMNVVFDNEGNLHMLGAMGICADDYCFHSDLEDYTYVKHFVYNFEHEEFHFNNIYPSGSYDIDEIYVPGDDDNDGIDDSGDPIKHFPSSVYTDNALIMHPAQYNNYKIVSSKDNTYLLAMWQDTTLARTDPNWWNYPIINFVISSDNGRSWSDVMSAHGKSDSSGYYPVFANSVYASPSDDFEINYDISKVNFTVYLTFLNDGYRGSEARFEHGGWTSNNIRYSKIEFEGDLIN